MLVVFDIDGTLADITYRLQKAGDAPKRASKKEFQSWLNKLQNKKDLLDDTPIKGMKKLAWALHNNYGIVYLTGRAEKYRDVTVRWLFDFGFPSGALFMREDEDMRETHVYKEEKMLDIIKTFKAEEIMVFDDDPEDTCGIMYKKHGWTHLKAMANYGD